MATTNGVNQRKAVNEDIAEDFGPNLHTLKSSGAMTISPELFEKVYQLISSSARD
jgi:hypothetical protein